MTPTNTEALADWLFAFADGKADSIMLCKAAAELRRLSALCAEWEAKAATWLASPEAAQRLEGYRELGRMCAELEAERDALLDALSDAATSLETIGRLAGEPYYGLDDKGEPIPTYMGHNDEVRSYANSRAGAARAAMKGTQ